MPDREKVISGLESHANSKACKTCAGDDCPYYHRGGSYPKVTCSSILAADALALLKEQEPRVMTVNEMIAAGKEEIAVFVEECPKGDPVRCFWGIAFPGMELPKDVPFNYPGGVDFNVTDVDGDIWDGDFYGMNAPLGWRAWTSRPTPEQMRETKWEGENDDSN